MMRSNTGGGGGTEGSFPLSISERNWSPRTLFFNCSQAAVATWCFIIGGYVSFYLPAGQGTIVMLAAMFVGMFFVFLATVPAATRYGLEAVRSTRTVFGTRGSLFTVALIFIFTVGWGTTLMIFSGKAAAELIISMGLITEGGRSSAAVVSSLVILAIVWALIRRGPGILRSIGGIVAISVLTLGILIIGVIIYKLGWAAIADATPTGASGDKLLDYTIAIELMLATALSWWPYVGGMARFSTSTRKSVMPVTFGLGLAVAVICLIGLYSGLVFPDSGGDPTSGLISIGGIGLATLAFAFVVVANIGTTMVGTYTAALALKQQPALDSRLSWEGATVLATGTSAVVILFLSEPFFNNFGTFLALSGVVFGPLCGIQIADYFLLRKQKLDLRGLYQDGPGTPYWYQGGFNIIGFVSMVLGVVTYFLLLDPVTFESTAMFRYLTASIPSILVSLGAYTLLTLLVDRTKPATVRASVQPANVG